MDENEVVALEVQMDTKAIEAELNEIIGAIGDLKNEIVKTIENIAKAFGILKGETQGVTVVTSAFAEMKKAVETVNGAASNAFKAMEQEMYGVETGALSLADSIGIIAQEVPKATEKLQNLMTQMAKEQTEDMWQGAISTIVETASMALSLREALKGISKEKVVNALSRGLEILGGGLTTVMGKICSALNKTKNSVSDMIKEAGNKFSAFCTTVKTGLVEAASAFVQFAQRAKAKLSELGPQMGELAGKVGSFFSGMGSSILTNITGLTTKVGAFFANMGTTALNSMTSLGQSIAAVFSGSILPAISTAFQSLSGGITAALGALSSPVGIAVAAIGAVIAAVALLVANWDKVKVVAAAVWEQVVAAWDSAAQWFSEHVTTPLGKLWQDFSSGFMKVWEEVGSFFKGTVNGIIGFVNGLISAAVKGINALINAMNSLHFTVPDWVPVLGGSRFGFSLNTLPTPQIPYLAQGAVLPANKPFLAMVGDQRHGTNIEAPLATIQEAVGLVMRDYAAANMAGHEATVEVLRDILTAVLGIEIGDTVIGQAAARYNRRMAVMRGGI